VRIKVSAIQVFVRAGAKKSVVGKQVGDAG
jgi:hypothetical protein